MLINILGTWRRIVTFNICILSSRACVGYSEP